MATCHRPNKFGEMMCRVWCQLLSRGIGCERDICERFEHVSQDHEREAAHIAANSRRARLLKHFGVATSDSKLNGHLTKCRRLKVNPIVVFVLTAWAPVDICGLFIIHAAPPSLGRSEVRVVRRVLVINDAVWRCRYFHNRSRNTFEESRGR